MHSSPYLHHVHSESKFAAAAIRLECNVCTTEYQTIICIHLSGVASALCMQGDQVNSLTKMGALRV